MSDREDGGDGEKSRWVGSGDCDELICLGSLDARVYG